MKPRTPGFAGRCETPVDPPIDPIDPIDPGLPGDPIVREASLGDDLVVSGD